jgi:tetratricopeptide (TPR) repeat protein
MRRYGKRVGLVVVGVCVCLMLVRHSWADPAEDAYNDGVQLMGERRLKDALNAFDKAIRLNPKYVQAYAGRGAVYSALGQGERAIKDYDEVIRLNPRRAEAYYDRANAYSDADQPELALKDYDAALALNPAYAEAIHNRSLVHLTLAHGQAATDARSYLDLRGWRDGQAQYMVLVGYFGYRYAQQNTDARKILDDALTQCDTTAWPYPIIRYLRREITAQDLLAAATDDNKKTEACTYLGLDLSLSGQRDAALPQLRWVKDNGNKVFVEYTFATAELGRLESATTAQP